MKIESIKTSDIKTLAYLHKKNLVSPSSKIGQKYLEKLYSLVLSDPKIHICLLANYKDEVIGTIIVTKDLEKTNKILRNLISSPALFYILKAVILGKVTVAELIRRFWFERIILRRFSRPYASILTLFVTRNHQRRGVGSLLVQNMIRELKRDRINRVHVDTLKSNKKALLFYQSLGFSIKDTISDSVVLEKQI